MCRKPYYAWLAFAVFVPSIVTAHAVELRSVQLTVLAGEEQSRFLAAHNAARKAVGVNPVAWSDELGKYSQEWLGQQKERLIASAKDGWAERHMALPDHRTDAKYGENIAGWMGTKRRAADWAVALWLHEKSDFDKLNTNGTYRVGDEAKEPDKPAAQVQPVVVGHYTTMVWRATTHIGAARLEFELVDDRGDARTYAAVVCNYSPPGNKEGERPY